jgi:hypothetical protein
MFLICGSESLLRFILVIIEDFIACQVRRVEVIVPPAFNIRRLMERYTPLPFVRVISLLKYCIIVSTLELLNLLLIFSITLCFIIEESVRVLLIFKVLVSWSNLVLQILFERVVILNHLRVCPLMIDWGSVS